MNIANFTTTLCHDITCVACDYLIRTHTRVARDVRVHLHVLLLEVCSYSCALKKFVLCCISAYHNTLVQVWVMRILLVSGWCCIGHYVGIACSFISKWGSKYQAREWIVWMEHFLSKSEKYGENNYLWFSGVVKMVVHGLGVRILSSPPAWDYNFCITLGHTVNSLKVDASLRWTVNLVHAEFFLFSVTASSLRRHLSEVDSKSGLKDIVPCRRVDSVPRRHYSDVNTMMGEQGIWFDST